MNTKKLTIKNLLKSSILSALFLLGSVAVFGQSEDELKKPSKYDKEDNVFDEKREVDVDPEMSSAKAPSKKIAVDDMAKKKYNLNYWSNKYEDRSMTSATKMMTAQETRKTEVDMLEGIQKKKEKKLEDIYAIVMDYPDFAYEYEFGPNGELQDVEITGIEDNKIKEQLSGMLAELHMINTQLLNKPSMSGTYYVTEDEAEPKMGYDDFFQQLYSNLNYPESAENRGVEGTMYVKFIVDPNGEVDDLQVSHDIETPYTSAVEAMKESAKEAVKATSGNWEPASIAGQKVSEYVVLPVKFDFNVNPALKAPIR